MFPTAEEALQAYVAASQEHGASTSATHELEWRFIFHNRDSKRRQLLALLLLPLGHVRTTHAEFRFKTRHSFSPKEVTRLYVGRSIGSIAYHLCFVALVAVGVGLVVTIVYQALGGVSLKLSAATIGFLVLAFVLSVAAARTRSLGLFGSVRLVARDAFDLLSIQKIKAPTIR
jgi:hypothetical protein